MKYRIEVFRDNKWLVASDAISLAGVLTLVKEPRLNELGTDHHIQAVVEASDMEEQK